MPFDDSNIRKLVRCQLERKIHFSRYKPLSTECKQLVLSLLEPDIKNRATIDQIKNNEWIKGFISFKINNESSSSMPSSLIENTTKITSKTFSTAVNHVQESTIKLTRTGIIDKYLSSILNENNNFEQTINHCITTTIKSIEQD